MKRSVMVFQAKLMSGDYTQNLYMIIQNKIWIKWKVTIISTYVLKMQVDYIVFRINSPTNPQPHDTHPRCPATTNRQSIHEHVPSSECLDATMPKNPGGREKADEPSKRMHDQDEKSRVLQPREVAKCKLAH